MSYWIYGLHAVQAALLNEKRQIQRVIISPNAKNSVRIPEFRRKTHIENDIRCFEKTLPKDAVHQGVAAEVKPLPEVALEDIAAAGPKLILALDQVTDPHNVGAILRSAAAFGAAAVVQTADHAAPENGALAKAASGALDIVPLVKVTNLAAAMEMVKKSGYWCVGLDGKTDKEISQAKTFEKLFLVLGAEGKGLRRLTAESCDLLVKIPIAAKMESLNVSNAAAVAMYALTH